MQIFYVDYGTVAEVPKKDVRFLHKRYSTDPIFAHRGCLDKCKPNNGIWTFEAMNAFTQRLIEHYDKPIMAKVTNINAQVKCHSFLHHSQVPEFYCDTFDLCFDKQKMKVLFKIMMKKKLNAIKNLFEISKFKYLNKLKSIFVV